MKLRILIVQGHRNTTGGNPAEMALTPKASRAIQRALVSSGYNVDMLQNDADWFPGTLDDVGREVVRRFDSQPYDVMLDVHFEGDANNTRGVFAIVPDGDGLRTTSPYNGSDAWASNTLDQRYASAITEGIATTTGLRLRRSGIRQPGLMSERQTGVGGKGYRLAMFGYTAKVRHRMVRLVLELGNIQGDADIINADGFFDRVAAGVVAGIGRVSGGNELTVIASPAPPEVPTFGTFTELAAPILVNVTAEALNARRWAETNQPIMRVLRRGNSFYARGWIVGERVAGNELWWVMGKGSRTDLQWRVWSGGTNYSVSDVLALPKKGAA